MAACLIRTSKSELEVWKFINSVEIYKAQFIHIYSFSFSKAGCSNPRALSEIAPSHALRGTLKMFNPGNSVCWSGVGRCNCCAMNMAQCENISKTFSLKGGVWPCIYYMAWLMSSGYTRKVFNDIKWEISILEVFLYVVDTLLD